MDDEDALRESIAEFLEILGFDVVQAVDGLEAVECFGEADPAFYALHWGLAVALALVFLGLSIWLYRRVHDRVRVTGELSSI